LICCDEIRNQSTRIISRLILSDLISSLVIIVPIKIDDASSRSTVKKIRFTPNETGVHYLNAKFGSEIVPGNEILISVSSFIEIFTQ